MTDTETIFQSNFLYRYWDPQKLAKVLKLRGIKSQDVTLCFLDWVVKDTDGEKAGEDDPVQLLEQLGVGAPIEDKAPVWVSDEDHPPDETEEEGVEVGHHHHIPREGKQLTPAVEKILLSKNTTKCFLVNHQQDINTLGLKNRSDYVPDNGRSIENNGYWTRTDKHKYF